ncbi:MAG: tRNA pseudouridine(55) synthase TruB [Gemmataceae bacterium]|nr:tRNA pseudouridine(55) synthase TruB [Gemmataceae bacterium]
MVPSGFLILDKPLGVTSRAAVDRAAQWFPRGTRLGHTGTLDPLATGVLVVAVGLGTRFTEYVQRQEKTYRAGVCLGARSDTDDGEGTITLTEGVAPIPREAIERTLSGFVGEFDQTPPVYSAAKVSGRRAYILARRGAAVDLTPRRVRIHAIHIMNYAFPDLDIEVRCGKGTYIRSLARDLGERLGCGAYLAALRRTRIGPFELAAALPLDADAEAARRSLSDLSWALAGSPRVELNARDADRFAQGQRLAWAGPEPEGEVAVFDEGGRFAGVGRIDDERRLHPVKVVSSPSSVAGRCGATDD